MYSQGDHPHQQPAPSEAYREEVAERLAEDLLARRSPEQRRLADTFYRRAREGAGLDDLGPLLDELGRTAAADFRPRRRTGR